MIAQKYNSAINTISNFLFPPKCIACGKLGEWICKDCQNTYLMPFPQECAACRNLSNNFETHKECLKEIHIENIYIAWYYNKFAKRLMKKFKYSFQFRIAETIIELVAQKFKNIFSKDSILVPVPSHRNRIKERGFNQSEIIASKIQELTDTKYEKLLEKYKETGHQVLKSREERVFSEVNPYRIAEEKMEAISGADVILVDDVCTTGTTLKLCAQALHPYKPYSIRAFTLFRGRRPRKSSIKPN